VESEDEDEGRAAAVTSKKQQKSNHIKQKFKATDDSSHLEVEDDNPTETLPKDVDAPQGPVKPGKRKASSFLDEVLAEKARKKKKKKKKQ
jgi:hypothetical protein